MTVNILALFDENMKGILLIILIAIILFGSAKIPQVARSLGRSVSEFKKGVREGEDEEKKAVEQKEADKKPG